MGATSADQGLAIILHTQQKQVITRSHITDILLLNREIQNKWKQNVHKASTWVVIRPIQRSSEKSSGCMISSICSRNLVYLVFCANLPPAIRYCSWNYLFLHMLGIRLPQATLVHFFSTPRMRCAIYIEQRYASSDGQMHWAHNNKSVLFVLGSYI